MEKQKRILDLTLKGDETINIEFKAKYDFASDKSEFLRDMVTLCNPLEQQAADEVAYLIIGAKGGKLLGTSELTLDESAIRAIVHAFISPKINFSMFTIDYEGSQIIAIEIIRTDHLYVIQKEYIAKKPKKIQGKEELVEDIVSPGECWVRDGTSKKQLTGEQIATRQFRLFKKRTDLELIPIYARISTLEKTISELQRATPIVTLTFEDGTESSMVEMSTEFREKQEWIDEQLSVIKERRPKIIPGQEKTLSDWDNYDVVSSLIWPGGDLSPKQISDYNAALDRWYEKLPTYAEKRYEFLTARRTIALISLKLTNTGNVPATDIDVEIQIAPGSVNCFRLRSAKYSKIKEPDVPPAPEYPKSGLSDFMRTMAIIHKNSIQNDFANFIPMRKIRKSNYSIKVSRAKLSSKIIKLKHGHEQAIRFCLILTSPGDSCLLRYRITAENIREVQTGMLIINNNPDQIQWKKSTLLQDS